MRDFRNLDHLEFFPSRGEMTVVVGENGSGKTSLIEAIGYLSTLRSFRGSPREALVRRGSERAWIRAELVDGTRRVTVEIELAPGRRDRILLNRQRVSNGEELLDVFQVTVFTPDDLVLVKGAPEFRRNYLDEVLEASSSRFGALRRNVERVLRQRNTLLRQANGRASSEVIATLEVWDHHLATAGDALVSARESLVSELGRHVAAAFHRLTRLPDPLQLSYRRSYADTLADALAAARDEDLRRGVTTVGPQRDDLFLACAALDARSRLSQGQQRAATLALRLAAHEVVTERRGSRPILLLDDAFSELDDAAAAGLLDELPAGQAILTTAGVLPPQSRPASVRTLSSGVLT